MKFATVVAVLGLASLCAAMPTATEEYELTPEMEKNRDECMKETGVTMADLKKEDNESSTIMKACLMKKDGVMTDDNKFSSERFIAHKKKFSKHSPEDIERVTKVAEECEKDFGTETLTEEEAVKKITRCLHTAYERDHPSSTKKM